MRSIISMIIFMAIFGSTIAIYRNCSSIQEWEQQRGKTIFQEFGENISYVFHQIKKGFENE